MFGLKRRMRQQPDAELLGLLTSVATTEPFTNEHGSTTKSVTERSGSGELASAAQLGT